MFPDQLHAPIVYPAALVTQAGDAQAFFEYLKGAAKVFAKHGFKTAQ